MKKYEKIVKTFIIGCICLILTGGTLRAQERQVIALPQTTMRIGDVLKEIEAKSPYKVSANLEMLDINRVVQFDRTDGTVQEIVAQLLSGTPNQYQITRGVVIITPSRPQPVVSSAPQELTFDTPGVPERQPRATRTPRPTYVDESQQEQQEEVPRESFTPIYVQAYEPEMVNPPSTIALKTNLLYGAVALTPNAAVEFGLGRTRRRSISAQGIIPLNRTTASAGSIG